MLESDIRREHVFPGSPVLLRQIITQTKRRDMIRSDFGGHVEHASTQVEHHRRRPHEEALVDRSHHLPALRLQDLQAETSDSLARLED